MDTVTISKRYNLVAFALMGLGIVSLVYGFVTDSHRTWANLVMSNYYFISLAIGAAFFFGLQYITQSGWSAMFRRVPEALMLNLPWMAIIMILVIFGISEVYHWAHHDATQDALLAHKSPYLNVPFFMIRMVVIFASWILLVRYLRKLSLEEDRIGGIQYLEKIEFWSKIFIFVLAITFSIASFDWVMSIEPHWYSTIFAFKNFAAAFYHGSSLVALVAIILYQRGYYKDMNESHLLDFSRYMFALSIIWGYLYFAQFALIWFGNLPEETIYYAKRWNNGWKFFFFFNFIVNWLIPFVGLLPQKLDKNIKFVKFICILLLIGLFTDVYEQVMPEITVKPLFGLTEIGIFAGLAGLFLYFTGYYLKKAPLIPKNHPYLEESTHHHLHSF